MSASLRIARAVLAASSLALAGCTSLLGDFTYDPNPKSSGNHGEQGDIIVMPPDGLITTEQGGKATFTITLKVKPTANVAIALSSSNSAEGTVNPISVSFTPENYAAPQSVQITGVDDDVADKTQKYTIRTSSASSEDPHYNGLDPFDPEVKNVDDETAGFLLMPPSGLVTTEAGGEATFTLLLTHAPTANVTVPLSSDNTAEGTVSPAALTFTPENWMAPQTVTVTGVDDAAPDKAQTYHIVTGPAQSTDTGYDKLDPDDATIVNQDNDTAGVMVTPSTGLLTFENPNGAMATFGIALNSPPSKDVIIALSSSLPAEGIVTPERVMFTPLNWMAPQLVTVTGVDDTRADGNQPYLIVTAPAQSDDSNYDMVDGPDAEVTNVDDDSPGLVVTPTLGLVTSEAGGATTFTVALASKPRGPVLLDVKSSRTTEGEVTPALLSFTEQNWNAPQMVTVTGIDDAVADGPQPYVVHVTPKPDSADGGYAVLLETDVSVSNIDDDSAGITVTAAPGLTTGEWGSSGTFLVALNSQPKKDVTIALISSDTTEGTVSPAALVFTAENYKAPQTVTIKGVNDDMADGKQPYKILTAPAVSDDSGYSGLDASNVDASNVDDDSAGIYVNPSNQTLFTSESGGTASFTLVLNSQPMAGTTVDIPISSSNTAEGTVSVSNLRFTTDNWRSPQTVTIKGVEDDRTADGAQPYRVVLGRAQSTDPNYEPIDAPDINVSNIDNDSPGITLINQNGLLTKEAGGMASFQIALNSKPKGDVTIGLSSSNTKEGTVTPATLIFTSVNFAAPQTVTITGINDDVADGNQTYRVITAAATSSDMAYNGMNAADPTVTNVDNDSPGIEVKPATGLSTKEDGSTASFTLALESQPTADVIIPLHSSNVKEGTVSPASVTFTAANWKSPRTVTITGVDDKVADFAQPYMIVTDPAMSADAKYKNLDGPDVSVSNIDDDSAGISVTPVTGDTQENGATASFTIALNSEPKSDVTIALSSSNTKEGTVSPTLLTFTAVNYKAPQKVTITGVDDKIQDGHASYSIDIAPAGSQDAGYAGLDAPDVSLRNIDDDSAGVLVSLARGDTTELNEGTTTFTIVLTSQPAAPVTIPLRSSNTDEGTLAVSQVTFSTTDYGSAKTITITGVDDMVADGSQPYTIIVGAATSTDELYAGLDGADVALSNIDDDSANLSVSASSGRTGEKNAATFTFTIALTSKPTADVSVPLSSSDTTEGTVSPATLIFTPANWKSGQPVTVTGVDDKVADRDQSYKVLIGAATSTDAGYDGLDYSPDVTVTNLDDDSASIDVSDAAGSTSEGGQTTTFTIVLNSQPAASVTIPLVSSATTEGTLTVTSVVFTTANWDSAQTVTVHGEDDESADGPKRYTIRTGAATSDDGDYDGLNADDVEVINIDNDLAGIEVSSASGPTSEGGGNATFTIVLNSKPTAAVSIPISSNNTDEGTLDATSVVFTTSNWSEPRTITVHGADDEVADGPQNYAVLLGKATSDDDAYAAIDPDNVALINNDNDSAGFEVSEALSTIAESGTSTTFEIGLKSQPKANVAIPLSVSDDTEAKLTVTSVTFTPTNWQAKQITVTGIDDDAVDGLQKTKVVTGLTTSTDPAYDDKNPPDVDITTTDNDSAFIDVTPPASSMRFTGESSSADSVTFSVVLTSMPSATVTIPLSSSLESEGVVSVPANGKLVFDSSNWDEPQSVTIVGVDDADDDGDSTYAINLGPSVSNDSGYDDKTPTAIMLTNVDDD